VIEILRAGDQAADFVGTQDGGEPPVSLRGREILLQLAPLQHPHKEEAQRRNMQAHRPHGQLLLFKQIRLIAAERVRPEPIDPAAPMILLAGGERVHVAANRGRRVIAPDHFLA
jgi:hypothetical protein